jgi:hypothetical protein
LRHLSSLQLAETSRTSNEIMQKTMVRPVELRVADKKNMIMKSKNRKGIGIKMSVKLMNTKDLLSTTALYTLVHH